MSYTLTYGGHTLPADITQQLTDHAINNLNVPPSYLITLLHYEGLWGGSSVAQQNNNWGGMTWNSSWSSPHTRASGVIVTRGTSRPANEGGYYIRYQTVQDFLTDWTHLIRRGGNYKVADSPTFADAVKGMFRVGGAQYDYATMNVDTSQERYELYLTSMNARRSSINSANNNALDDLDEGTGTGGKPAYPTTEGLPITSGYGYRGDIGVPGASHYHWAIDIGGGGVNHPIYATQDGIVTHNSWNDLTGWRLRIQHTGDPYHSQYQHLQVQSPLSVGTAVRKGDTIGTMGTTGASSGIHLDFAISINGTFYTEQDTIDPEEYLQMSFGGGGGTPSPSRPGMVDTTTTFNKHEEGRKEMRIQVKAGDSLSKIAQKYNVHQKDIRRLVGITNPNLINVGEWLSVPTEGRPRQEYSVSYYTVKPGDTLSEIAQRFETTTAKLQTKNNIRNANLIQVGQVLRL